VRFFVRRFNSSCAAVGLPIVEVQVSFADVLASIASLRCMMPDAGELPAQQHRLQAEL
jgi:hypothetical protein